MEIDNDRSASIAKGILITVPFVMLLVSGLLAIFLIIFTWIPVIISGILVITGWAITVALKLKSVKFRFSDETLSVLYYPISPMTSSFKRIDIDADKLLRYEIRKSLGGLNKELILYENIGGQEASYPPVSVTLCSRETIGRIAENLDSYCSAGISS